jgi:hypothetical protein
MRSNVGMAKQTEGRRLVLRAILRRQLALGLSWRDDVVWKWPFTFPCRLSLQQVVAWLSDRSSC